ncbi:hypothetical protein V5799_012100 [Amblyomma americanum]|uniref:Uncharacterized protein n=1 Tax=Amblyomma americanum TaxID=6943 RepID=A0AAQ4EF06_AMBAM
MEPFHFDNTFGFNRGSHKAREERSYCKASSVRFQVKCLVFSSEEPTLQSTSVSEFKLEKAIYGAVKGCSISQEDCHYHLVNRSSCTMQFQ